MDMQTSRRALLGTLALAPIAGAVVAAPPALLAAASKTDFAEKLSLYQKLNAEARAYQDDVFMPASEAAEAAEASIPHRTVQFDRMGAPTGGTVSTSNRSLVAQAKMIVANADEGHHSEAFAAGYRRLLDAYHEREREVASAVSRTGLAQIDATFDEMSTRAYDAKWAMYETAATTIAEAHAKLAVILEHEDQDCARCLEHLARDLSQLAGKEA